MIAIANIPSPEYNLFDYKEILERQADETRTGICPKCRKTVTVLGWVTHSNGTRHIQARCMFCGVRLLVQTEGNIALADVAERDRKRKFKAQADLDAWVIT